MSFKSDRALDGYTLNSSNNTFLSPWIDFHSSPFVCLVVVFSASGVAGTLTVEQSCDREAVYTNGAVIPASAWFTGTYGVGQYGDPIDLIQVNGASLTVSGNSTPYVPMNSNIAGARWYRVKYIASNSVAGTVTVLFSRKSSS